MVLSEKYNYIIVSALALLLTICFSCTFNSLSNKELTTYNELKIGFNNPSASAHPKVYWWCLNGNIDTIRAKQELKAMKDAGIGGFDLFEIGVPPGDTMIPGGPAFLSDESLKSIKIVLDEAKKHGLSVGLNLASSWNAGGKWISPKHGGKSLYVSKIEVQGNLGKQTIKLTFPKISFPNKSISGRPQKPILTLNENGKPAYYEDISVLAIPTGIQKNSLDTSQIFDITRFFNPGNEMLNWNAPPGKWEIHRYVCSNSGQQMVLPSPHSAGLTVDHFDSTAVATHLNYIINRLETVMGDLENTALKSFYLASYEARGFVWTPSLATEFKKLNGYDISKLVPALFNPDLFTEELSQKLDADFKRTLSELMINNLYKNAREICNSYGLKINCEAGGPGFPIYNGPAEPLKALGNLDIPRGEFWINHSRLYKDGNNSIDVLRVVKEVAAASHIYRKGIVEQEAFTSFQQWQEGPFDMKPTGDRAFCEGMNRVVFHGFSHNISGSGYPGYVYHAGTHFNDKRVWWPKAKPFIQYLSRISSIAQNTDFVADVLWYYGDKTPNSATPKNTHFKVGAGYDYEVINTEILLDSLSVNDEKLKLTNGAEFSILVLENEKSINPKVLKKLDELALQGAIIIGEKPTKTTGYKTTSSNLITKLWHKITDANTLNLKGKGKVYSGISPLEMIHKLNIAPDFNYIDKESNLLDFIHYCKNNIDFYFIRNTSNQWISRNCDFRQTNKFPELWNPVSGEIIPISIFKHHDNYTSLPLTLPPKGSQLIVFKNSNNTECHFTSISNGTQNPPFFQYIKEGILLLSEEKIELENSNKQSLAKEISHKVYELTGSWDISFPEGWGAPGKATFPLLTSWTESKMDGIKYFSGTATYNKSFMCEIDKNNNIKHYLDLGELSKVGEAWLNGVHLGIIWAKPYKFDVTKILKQGENNLVVEVANTWSNRITGDAITKENYTNTNIRNTILPTEGILEGDQTRVAWTDVPLIKSGLLGPVKIISVQVITTNEFINN